MAEKILFFPCRVNVVRVTDAVTPSVAALFPLVVVRRLLPVYHVFVHAVLEPFAPRRVELRVLVTQRVSAPLQRLRVQYVLLVWLDLPRVRFRDRLPVLVAPLLLLPAPV